MYCLCITILFRLSKNTEIGREGEGDNTCAETEKHVRRNRSKVHTRASREGQTEAIVITDDQEREGLHRIIKNYTGQADNRTGIWPGRDDPRENT